jgi:hypothetical protein
MGTGFLVGPDAVLTNYHVMESVLANGSASSVLCRFDYKVLSDGSRDPGVEVKLHATDWKLDYSPFTQSEKAGEPDKILPTKDELDYALVRLARPVGQEPGNPRAPAGAPARGWVNIPAADPNPNPAFDPHAPLLIAQHPDGSPLKLAVDTDSIIALNSNSTRVRYATNTEAGASGSPCFDLEWQLIALHHYGDPAYGQPRYNQGIPIGKIRDRVRRPGAESAAAAIAAVSP